MIHEALKFLVDQLNEYLFQKMGEAGLVIRSRLVTSEGKELNLNNKIVCQLVNVEEERIGKAQVPLAPPVGSGFPVRNPEIRLNLSVLFTAISPDTTPTDGESDQEYEISIKMLGYVIQFFQYRHYFTTENSPSLPHNLGSLVVELYPVTLESQNYLWASLGAKYRPSVVYKVRLITVYEDAFSDIVSVPSILNTHAGNRPTQ
ncbi:MAG: DUF4255 domain-containing protein [Bacteroidetes bacterium]|nr:DUF4255 domain-containing protein [Bacteroidota bacterium]MBP6639815.1 DUF4255 domain-containing protein [Bacteroidia bacterium]